MKCPLYLHSSFTEDRGLRTVQHDCLKEECAWWDNEDHCCCVYAIPLGLLHIFKMLVDIERKMPKDLAPRG